MFTVTRERCERNSGVFCVECDLCEQCAYTPRVELIDLVRRTHKAHCVFTKKRPQSEREEKCRAASA